MAEIPVTGYIPPGAYTFRDPLLGTAVLVGAPRIPAVIGTTRGALVTASNEAFVKGAIGGTDCGLHQAEVVKAISLTSGGANAFFQGIDYRISASGCIDWSPNTLLTPPSGLTCTETDLGGTLPGGTYTYVVTARKRINLTGPIYGETVVSASTVCVVGGSASGKVVLSWDAVTGAEDYRVWRFFGTTFSLLATVLAPTTTYSDIGTTALQTSIHPPTSNTAFKQPAVGQTYYVTYQYRQKTFQTPQLFTSVTAVLDSHGAGSDLAIAAELILAQPPFGQGAPAVILVAVQNDANADYLTALDKLRFFLPAFIVPLRTNEELNQKVVQHVVAMSSFRQKRERTAIVVPPITKADGTPTTDSDIQTMAGQLNFTDDFGAPSGRRALFLSETQTSIGAVLQTDGTRSDTTLRGAFLAAAVAGKLSSLPDTATPLTGKVITNATVLSQRDEATKDLLATAGVCVIHDEGNGLATVRQQLSAASINSGAHVEDQEFSIVITDDLLAQNLRIAYRIFIGQKLTDQVKEGIKGATIRVLNNMKKQELIDNFDPNTVEVRQSTEQPTFVLVFFKYFPLFPTNAVIAKYGFDTIAG